MKNNKIALIIIFIIAMFISACASLGSKDETPPVITVIQNTTSISPNMDGNQDELILKVNINDSGFIKYWKLEIYNSNKEIVKVKESHSDIENEKNKFFNQKSNIEIPDTITWDGKDNSGNIVPDGEYYFQFFAMDNKKNITPKDTNIGKFIVDSKKPEIKIKSQQNSYIFSPDGDGSKDELIIDLELIKASVDNVTTTQDATQDQIILDAKTTKQTFTLEIINNQGDIVKTYTLEAGSKQLKWDGKDENDNQMPDGVYKIKVYSTDEAGNYTEQFLPNIVISTGDTPIFFTLSDNKISPNGDDHFDTIDFNLEIEVKKGIDYYQLDIINAANQTVRTYKGKKDVPEKITWDGKRSLDQQLQDGYYSAKLMVVYTNGNKPIAESEKIILDTTPPEFSITKTPQYFSPDNDGENEELTMMLKTKDFAGMSYWRVDIMNPDKDGVFRSFAGEGKPTDKIVWGGLSEKGQLVESAEDYPVKVYTRDIVGNSIEKEIGPISVDILIQKLKDGRLKVKVSNIQFLPNSARMTRSPKNKKILDLLGKALRKYRQYNITIEGHANRYAKGLDEKKAKDLSELRAKTIAQQLTKRMIPLSRMKMIGRGFDVPLIPYKPKMTKAEKKAASKNRRVEFYLEKN